MEDIRHMQQTQSDCVLLTLYIPTLPKTNAYRKTPLEIHFIYLDNKDIYCIKTCFKMFYFL
jgi:hypothetical protein